jgi:hypothetical protein
MGGRGDSPLGHLWEMGGIQSIETGKYLSQVRNKVPVFAHICTDIYWLSTPNLKIQNLNLLYLVSCLKNFGFCCISDFGVLDESC